MPQDNIKQKVEKLNAITTALASLSLEAQHIARSIPQEDADLTTNNTAHSTGTLQIGQQVVITSRTGGLQGYIGKITKVLPKSIDIEVTQHDDIKTVRRLQTSVIPIEDIRVPESGNTNTAD